MTTQLLIYNNVVPLSSERHLNWRLKPVESYSFASEINFVPILAAEFLQASSVYPIVFVGGGDQAPMPVAVLSLQQDKNSFIKDHDHWDARYIPAFVRRYPFVFSRSQDQTQYFLCIDEDYAGFSEGSEGEPLFQPDGNPTDFTSKTLDFLSQYQAEFQRTEQFAARLQSLNLLDRKQVSSTDPDSGSEKLRLSGFYTVDRSRLGTLLNEPTVELVRSGDYELICHHLASLSNFTQLRDG